MDFSAIKPLSMWVKCHSNFVKLTDYNRKVEYDNTSVYGDKNWVWRYFVKDYELKMSLDIPIERHEVQVRLEVFVMFSSN